MKSQRYLSGAIKTAAAVDQRRRAGAGGKRKMAADAAEPSSIKVSADDDGTDGAFGDSKRRPSHRRNGATERIRTICWSMQTSIDKRRH